jgi:hypothetical protein
VTDDALRSELDNLRKFFSHGVAELRGDIQAARTEAAEGHERLREDLTRRLSDAVEAKVRIRILEDNQKASPIGSMPSRRPRRKATAFCGPRSSPPAASSPRSSV